MFPEYACRKISLCEVVVETGNTQIAATTQKLYLHNVFYNYPIVQTCINQNVQVSLEIKWNCMAWNCNDLMYTFIFNFEKKI